MPFPDKPLTINLDTIGLDAWIMLTELPARLEAAQGSSDMRAIGDSLRAARELLVLFLRPSGWTDEEIGRVNLAEMLELVTQIGEGLHGPKGTSGLPSMLPSPTAGRSPSAPASSAPRRNGRVPRGKLRPSSA